VIYQVAADRLGDAEFVPGALDLLVAGNQGRLLDPRRTPVAVTRVALSNGGPGTRAADLWRQIVPCERLLMTFLETAALNARFKEAEAVLIGDHGNGAF
jgi:hypothetical protein